MRLFFDASAFIKRYIAEAGSQSVESLCDSAEDVAVSLVCPAEILSAARRLKREGKISADQYTAIKSSMLADIADISLVQIDSDTVKNAIGTIELSPCKALDAVHIGCAIQWNPDFFISSDIQQIAAAKKMGLKVKHV
jgi:uncharacterized protein